MTSEGTRHVARCVGGDRWVVSWLPGRTLSGQQAVTAMTIAVMVSDRDTQPQRDAADTTPPRDPPGPAARTETAWTRLDAMALELGLTSREAIYLVASEHHDLG